MASPCQGGIKGGMLRCTSLPPPNLPPLGGGGTPACLPPQEGEGRGGGNDGAGTLEGAHDNQTTRRVAA